jgi:hypothetical protein
MSSRGLHDEVLTGNVIDNTKQNTKGANASVSQKRVEKPFEKLLNTVRDVKDGHRRRFFGNTGVTASLSNETNNISNKDWLMCFKAHHYRDCQDFDLGKAMQGCRYTQIEPDRDTSDYIIPKSYKSPSISSEKKKFRQMYDDMYNLLKKDEYYSRIFPSNQDGVIECPTQLTKPNVSKAHFPEDKKLESKEIYEDKDYERGAYGPGNKRIPEEWSYWGDQGDPKQKLKDLNHGLLDLKNNQVTISSNIRKLEKMRGSVDTSRRAQKDKAYAIRVMDKQIEKLNTINKEIDDMNDLIEAAKQQENQKKKYPSNLEAMVKAEDKFDGTKYHKYIPDPREQYKYPNITHKTMREVMKNDPSIINTTSSILKKPPISHTPSAAKIEGGRKKRTKKKRKGRKKVNKKTTKRRKKINRRSKRIRNTRRK